MSYESNTSYNDDHSPIIIPIQRLEPSNPLPRFAYVGDAGMDLRAACDFKLAPFERMAVPCGMALAIPHGYAGLVLPRSGLAAKHGISLVNSPGLIDSNYRGEIKAILVNLDPTEPFAAQAGDRIAQLVIIKVPAVCLAETDQLDTTERGIGGFGSSGR
ncbi:dUTP diphosphatase [Adlercreutzia sp. ZJ141]|uniref:dUTP diphosphatase n=1 Tax=Adlercreutzia sp. ZJ141 TaxID=2709406 RepID=UPI0013EE373A|nr:dUTP diphosphatase [Adlercreutzia sp. ZJ141]